MKTRFVLLICLSLAFAGCKKDVQTVQVCFENQSMWDFTNVIINDKYSISGLQKGYTSQFIVFDNYKLHNNKPEPENFSAQIASNTRLAFVQSNQPLPGESIAQLKPGTYTVVITSGYFTNSSNTYIRFEFK